MCHARWVLRIRTSKETLPWSLGCCTKTKFSIKDFFSKCDQIRSFLRIWSHLLEKSLMENFIFCAVGFTILSKSQTWYHQNLKLSLKVSEPDHLLMPYNDTYLLILIEPMFHISCGSGQETSNPPI